MIPAQAFPPGPKQSPAQTHLPLSTTSTPQICTCRLPPYSPSSCLPLMHLHKSNSLAALLLRRHTTAELFRDSCFHPILLNVVSESLRKSIWLTIDISGLSTQTQSDVGEHLWQHINNSTKLREETQSRVNLLGWFLQRSSTLPLFLPKHDRQNTLQMQFYTELIDFCYTTSGTGLDTSQC